MQIDKPIMRGFTLEDEEEQKEGSGSKGGRTNGSEDEEDGDWCRFEYEFLPDFCYTCGMIGHGDKDCLIKVKKGEKQQFGR